MPHDIIIPNLGESVTSGVLGKWVKNDGDYVKRDELVAELETDKINMELLAPVAGILKQSIKVGETVKVGASVGSVSESAAPASAGAPSPAPAPAPVAEAKPATNGAASPKPAPAATPATPPAPAPVASAPVAATATDVRATPLAKKLAEEHKVDLAGIAGTGAGGRVREQDVLAAVQSRTSAPPAAPSPAGAPRAAPATVAGSRAVRREKMSPLRQRVAARLVEAQHTAAMLTTFNECDMSAVMELRSRYKENFEKQHGIGLGFMSFFVKATVGALKRFPAVNASIVTTQGGAAPEIEYHDYQDIAVAIGTPRGLVVPVLRDCDTLSFAQVESSIKDLAVRAKDGKLSLNELQGGTFTITNGGVYGSLMSTPILNPPQTAILGMHAIKNRAVEDPKNPGQVAIRPMMYLALSYDHRLIDGSEAVQFLVAIKNAIEDPQRLLLGL
jgi:2-oxoglutarate dehydrogenase E2 component (dihydrolipoamide succinyltransferase)